MDHERARACEMKVATLGQLSGYGAGERNATQLECLAVPNWSVLSGFELERRGVRDTQDGSWTRIMWAGDVWRRDSRAEWWRPRLTDRMVRPSDIRGS